MASRHLPLQNRGVFRNLPTFHGEIQGLTAIVTGANGISGFHTLRALLQSPNRWGRVFTLSRSPIPEKMMALIPEGDRERVQHVSVDFLADPEDISRALKVSGVTADVVFFYSYMQPKSDPGTLAWSNAEALVEVNSTLIRHFVTALRSSSIRPKRFLLQTGAKNYGGHVGPTVSPWMESAPRVTSEPNFYYDQEDIVINYCREATVKWNIIRPCWIIGAVENAQMNAYYGLAVYAAVQAYLGKNLEFPGTMRAWLQDRTHSHALLTGYLSEWAVLEEDCANQAFNASDMSSSSWAVLWPELARWFGGVDVNIPCLDESSMHYIEQPGSPPLGYGPHGYLRFSWSFVSWAKQSENHNAWKAIMTKHGLVHDPFLDSEALFTFTDIAVLPDACGSLAVNKSRSMGWNGFVDTALGLFEAHRELNVLRMLPPMVVDEARPTW